MEGNGTDFDWHRETRRRLERVEVDMGTLTTQLSTLAAAMEKNERQTHSQLAAIQNAIAEMQKVTTPWGVIASWLGVGVVIWSMSLAPLYREVITHDKVLADIQKTIWTREDAVDQRDRIQKSVDEQRDERQTELKDLQTWQRNQDTRILELERGKADRAGKYDPVE